MTSVCESQENQRWSKRGLPQQPQANDSIDAEFSNLLVRPVYLLELRQIAVGVRSAFTTQGAGTALSPETGLQNSSDRLCGG
jgi:hypothetical protein